MWNVISPWFELVSPCPILATITITQRAPPNTSWPPLLWPSALGLSRSPGLLNRRPRGLALCWMMAFFTASYQQLLWTPTQSGALRAPSAWCGFPYHISTLFLTVWLPALTELYNSSTPTQSPTQSLEWHVWSSSSWNNCHAVQRSLSSGASVYECIMCFTLSHFISQIHPRDLFRLLAIGMWHFLLVHHLGMASLAGSKVKIQHYWGLQELFFNCRSICISGFLALVSLFNDITIFMGHLMQKPSLY